MNVRKWSVLALLSLMVFLIVGCEEAQTLPQSRDLVVVNDTTDAQIFVIDLTAVSFGQKAIAPIGAFYFSEESVMEPDDRFAIVLSPYVYRVVVSVRYSVGEGETYSESSRMVTLDLPVEQELPTYITLSYDADGEIPGYILEVTGEYVNSNIANFR